MMFTFVWVFHFARSALLFAMYLVLILVFLIGLALNTSADFGMEESLWSDVEYMDVENTLSYLDYFPLEQPGLFNAGTVDIPGDPGVNSLGFEESLDLISFPVTNAVAPNHFHVDYALINPGDEYLSDTQLLADGVDCVLLPNNRFNRRQDQCFPLRTDDNNPSPQGPLPRNEPDPAGLPTEPDESANKIFDERFERNFALDRWRPYPPMIPRYENDPEDPCDPGQFAVCDSGNKYDRYPQSSGLYNLDGCMLCMCSNSTSSFCSKRFAVLIINLGAGWFVPWTPEPCYEPRWIWCCNEYYAPMVPPVSCFFIANLIE